MWWPDIVSSVCCPARPKITHIADRVDNESQGGVTAKEVKQLLAELHASKALMQTFQNELHKREEEVHALRMAIAGTIAEQSQEGLERLDRVEECSGPSAWAAPEECSGPCAWAAPEDPQPIIVEIAPESLPGPRVESAKEAKQRRKSLSNWYADDYDGLFAGAEESEASSSSECVSECYNIWNQAPTPTTSRTPTQVTPREVSPQGQSHLDAFEEYADSSQQDPRSASSLDCYNTFGYPVHEVKQRLDSADERSAFMKDLALPKAVKMAPVKTNNKIHRFIDIPVAGPRLSGKGKGSAVAAKLQAPDAKHVHSPRELPTSASSTTLYFGPELTVA